MTAFHLALRFLLELLALAAFGYWGATADAPLAARLLLAVAAPAGAGLVWGFFVAPRARIELSPTARASIALLVFATAAVLLAARAHERLAAAFLLTAVANAILLMRTAPAMPTPQREDA